MANLSSWFEWPTKPVHVGAYEFWFKETAAPSPFLRSFDGEQFSFLAVKGDRWRGLAERPAEHDCEQMGCKHG